jgi:ribosomal protein S12 methylthiotransferase accessory factor YcaO
MKLSFTGINSRDAGLLSRELSSSLKQSGVPAEAISVDRDSDESMDLGSILSFDMGTIVHTLGSVGHVAVLGKCIYELIDRNKVTVVIKTSKGSIEIPSKDIDLDHIEEIISKLDAPAELSK